MATTSGMLEDPNTLQYGEVYETPELAAPAVAPDIDTGVDAATVDFEPAEVTTTTQAPSAYEPEPYTPPAMTETPEAVGYDPSGLLGTTVEDINVLTSGEGALMRGADTRAKQAAQERGLLSSSMAIGAAEAERLKTVMPLAERMMQTRAEAGAQEAEFGQELTVLDRNIAGQMGLSTQEYQQQLSLADQANAFNVERENAIRAFDAEQSGLDRELQTAITDAEIAARMGLSEQEYKQQFALSEQSNAFISAQNLLDRKHDINLMDADFAGRQNLIDLEMGWSSFINTNKAAAEVWREGVEAMGEILASGLDQEQLDNAMDYYLGVGEGEDYIPGVLSQTLDTVRSIGSLTPADIDFESAGVAPPAQLVNPVAVTEAATAVEEEEAAGLLAEERETDPTAGRVEAESHPEWMDGYASPSAIEHWHLERDHVNVDGVWMADA